MKLINLLPINFREGICVREPGEPDEVYIQRCGNALTYPPDYPDTQTPYSMKNPVNMAPFSKALNSTGMDSEFDNSGRDDDNYGGRPTLGKDLDKFAPTKDTNYGKDDEDEMDVLGTDLDSNYKDAMTRTQASQIDNDLKDDDEETDEWVAKKTLEILKKHSEKKSMREFNMDTQNREIVKSLLKSKEDLEKAVKTARGTQMVQMIEKQLRDIDFMIKRMMKSKQFSEIIKEFGPGVFVTKGTNTTYTKQVPSQHSIEHPDYEEDAIQNQTGKFTPPNRKIMQVRSIRK